jgi:hypothetical protein
MDMPEYGAVGKASASAIWGLIRIMVDIKVCDLVVVLYIQT